MKLAMYTRQGEPDERARVGLVVGDRIADLREGYEALLGSRGRRGLAAAIERAVPATLTDLLRADGGLGVARETLAHVANGASATVALHPLAQCRLHAPLRPSKLIAVGRNYLSHTESVGTKVEMQVPSAWIKANSAITGPMDDIVKPRATRELDYETELSFVIGKRCRDVPESRAYDVIAGYTIVNDVSARDIARIERKEANQLLGKMFDTFAPMGPWLVTADEIADPMKLRLTTRVNGELRQDASTSTVIWPIPKLLAYISQMTLEPGDVITTGTPDGCAMGRKPGESSWYLQPGDVVESSVEGVGTMRNRVVAESDDKVRSWDW